MTLSQFMGREIKLTMRIAAIALSVTIARPRADGRNPSTSERLPTSKRI